MKHLLETPKLLTIILFFLLLLLLPSCNNEELFVVEESAIVAEETEPTEEEEEPNTEDEVIPIDTIDDNVTTTENIPVDIEPYLNDENLPQTATISNTNPSNGVLTINYNSTPNNFSDDSIVYTPNTGFSGIDSFEYTMCDATNTDNCDTAIVEITVEAAIDIPDDTFENELKAFPSAEGAGKYVTGGRGYPTVHVTNLNDSGPGSFRDALGSNRTIVFDVSGTITTTSGDINAYGYSNLTIAGQTAPEGGITIKGHRFIFDSCNNVILRYLRFRGEKSKQAYGAKDNLNFYSSYNMILDHVSASYGGDENMDLGNGGTEVNNITVQRTVIGEGKTGMMFQAEGPTSFGEVTIYKNLYANNHHRTPNISSDFKAEVINCIVYNWQVRMSTNTRNSQVNYINNYYKPGSMTWARSPHFQQGNILPDGGNQKVYNSGNHWYGEPSFTADNWLGWADADSQNYRKADQSNLQSTYDAVTRISVTNPVINIDTALDAFTDVLNDVGANKTLDASGNIVTYIDSVDQVHIDDVTNGTHTTETNGNYQWYESAPLDYGNPPSNTRAAGYDTDADGMPDLWERAKFGDLTKDGRGDTDGDGYTDLEEFLNIID